MDKSKIHSSDVKISCLKRIIKTTPKNVYEIDQRLKDSENILFNVGVIFIENV